jgi:hypothetical protein
VKDWRLAVTFLENELAVLEEEHLKKKQRLQDTIQDIYRRHDPGRSQKVPKSAPADAEQNVERTRKPRRKKPAVPTPKRRGRRPRSEGDVPLSHLVAEAGGAQPGDFTIADLRTFLDTNYPERAAQVTNDEISKQVWTLRQGKRPKFFLVRQATTKGGMNTYRYNHPQNPPKK